MARAWLGLIASVLVAGSVHASEVTLSTPITDANGTGQPLAYLRRVHPAVLNKEVFDASTVLVVVNGKRYRFIGSRLPTRSEEEHWSGKTANGRQQLNVSRFLRNGRMVGGITLSPFSGMTLGEAMYDDSGRRPPVWLEWEVPKSERRQKMPARSVASAG